MNEKIKNNGELEASGHKFLDRENDYNFSSLITSAFVVKLTYKEAQDLSEYFDKNNINIIYQNSCKNCFLKIIRE